MAVRLVDVSVSAHCPQYGSVYGPFGGGVLNQSIEGSRMPLRSLSHTSADLGLT
jgi:hypothetical protein